MSRVLSRISLVLVAAIVFASPALAQLPPVTEEQAAMGALVRSVAIEPGEVSLLRGDSVQVRVVLQDKDGNPVEGALAFMFSPNTDVVEPRIGRQRSDGTFQFLAAGPGSIKPILVVRVNEDDGEFRGMAVIRQVGTLDFRQSASWRLRSSQSDIC